MAGAVVGIRGVGLQETDSTQSFRYASSHEGKESAYGTE